MNMNERKKESRASHGDTEDTKGERGRLKKKLGGFAAWCEVDFCEGGKG